MRKWASILPVAALAVVLISLPIMGTGCQKLQARDHLNKGVTAFKNAQYPESVAALAAVLISLPIMGTGCQKLQARDHLNKGVTAFKNAQYPESVEHFKTAVALDPTFSTARLYLAMAYLQQYIPGAESEENNNMAKAAYDQFSEVLKQDPKNTLAIQSIASLY